MAVTKEEKRNVTIELDEEVEGDLIESEEHFFEKIGEPVPLKLEDSSFDLQRLPVQGLAVSDRFQSIFVAHSGGFYVVKTKDVIASAKKIKEEGSGPCIQELCIVDPPIGKVHILALSRDSSILSVSVGATVHFFSVTSLLKKRREPFLSRSINSIVKDFRWRKKSENNSYVVLSRGGKLYHGDVDVDGDGDGFLKEVMDYVDAVDWNAKGSFIAVARKNTLSILSHKFRERFHVSLCFKSWTSDTDSERNVIVDSIKWVRRDCIILGCIQVTEDGEEDGYLVQVITSRDGKFTEDTSKRLVLSFKELFTSITEDMVPFGSGPYLFLSYLEDRELAIAANRKSTDQHITLLGWSVDDEQKNAAVIDLTQDNRWLPRIELQENDDDNLILGFGVDKVSLNEKINVKLGVEEQELSPCCILLCLTLEAKLVMFYFASATETQVLPQISVDSSDKEEDSAEVVPLTHDSSNLPRLEEHGRKGMGLVVKSQEMNQQELNTKEGGRVVKENELKITAQDDSLNLRTVGGETFKKETYGSSNASLESAGSSQGLVHSLVSNKNLEHTQSSTVDKLPVKSPFVQGITKEETQKLLTPLRDGVKTDSFTGSVPNDASTTFGSNHKVPVTRGELTKGFPGNIGSVGFPGGPNRPQSSMKSFSSNELNARSPSFSLSFNEASRLESSGSAKTSKDSNAVAPPSIHSFGGATQSGGQKAFIGARKFEPEPAIRSSPSSLQGNSALGNSLNFKLQHTQETSRNPQSSGLPGQEPELPKHFGSVNQMAKELDALLSSIEQEGGFKDACTVFQKKSVVVLERGLEDLSERCRAWKNKMEERLREIQHLLDKNVQVFARKVYMEGIVKQASDSQYWDLWNRQKLSPELEQKRRQMLKINQDLTNQLIELERHFNTLEISKFGENSGFTGGRRVLHSSAEPSRGQSLHSLYNTMNSQLAAAEQLSDCLSNQMSVLNIESPSVKRQSVAKELFESIGLPYGGDSFNSPDMKKGGHSPDSIKKLPFSSYSAATKEQSRRNSSSAMKNFEPETARRRRDSLDRSWVSFEPPKTTVKRILLQEERERISTNRSSLVTSKKNFSTQMKPPRDETPSSTSLYSSVNKDMSDRFQANQVDKQDKPLKQAPGISSTSFKWANDYSGQAIVKSPPTPITQKSSLVPLSSALSYPSSSPTFQVNAKEAFGSDRSGIGMSRVSEEPKETFGFGSDRSSSGTFHVSKFDSSEAQPVSVSKTVSNLHYGNPQNQTPGTTTNFPAQIALSVKKPLHETSVNELPNSKSGVFAQTKATVGTITHGGVIQDSFSAASMISSSSAFLSVSAVPPAATLNENVGLSETVTTKVQFGMSATAAPPTVSVPQSGPSFAPSIFPLSTLSSSTAISALSFSSSPMSKPYADANRVVSSQSTSSSTSSSFSPSFLSSNSFLAPKEHNPSSIPSVSLNSTSPVPSMEPKPSVGECSLKSEMASTSQTPPSQPDSHLKSEMSVKQAPENEVSVQLASGSHSSLLTVTSVPSDVSNVSSNSQPEVRASEPTQYPATVSASGSLADGKNENLDSAITQEDEMEEEAPETMSELSLESLGSFGLGSAPTTAAPKSNPFGAPFGNTQANPVSTQFSLPAPTGQQLFRPASFSFQPVQPSQPTSAVGFSGGFNTGTSAPEPTVSVFGQPSQVGPGQQALGSVLGAFGQSRQLGTGVPGNAFAPASGFGGAGFGAAANSGGTLGFGAPSTGGFASAATGGGFAALASGGGGGFAGAATAGGGGFAGHASGGGGGFAGAPTSGGGFGGAASAAGGGFGAFNSNQGGGGFSAFGSNTAGKPPSQLFTQMRR